MHTPGHTGFSAEIERSFWVRDAAVLLVDAAQGVQPQNETLFHALKDRGVPELLDAMTEFLPGPAASGDELCGVVFAVARDKVLGRGAWVRLFGGKLENRTPLDIRTGMDPVTGEPVFVQRKISQIRSAGGGDAGVMRAGDVAVVYGLGDLKTGYIFGNPEKLPPESAARLAENAAAHDPGDSGQAGGNAGPVGGLRRAVLRGPAAAGGVCPDHGRDPAAYGLSGGRFVYFYPSGRCWLTGGLRFGYAQNPTIIYWKYPGRIAQNTIPVRRRDGREDTGEKR